MYQEDSGKRWQNIKSANLIEAADSSFLKLYLAYTKVETSLKRAHTSVADRIL